MTKRDVKTWGDLEAFAAMRAGVSMKRNDPIAWSYWEDTRRFAEACQASPIVDPATWCDRAYGFVRNAKVLRDKDPREAARQYSRAKWLRILSMNSNQGGVKPLSLDWLKNQEMSNA